MENASDRIEFISYLKNVSVGILTVTLFIFPSFFLLNLTDFFVLPKQILLIAVSIILLVLWGIRQVIMKRLTFVSNPFNLPVALFGIAILVSSIMSLNRFDSLSQTIPVLGVLLLYFVAVNTYDNKKNFMIGLSALLAGGVLTSLLVILYTFKIYVLPFPAIQVQYFNTFGSAIQYLIYVIPLFLLAAVSAGKRKNLLKSFQDANSALQGAAALVIIIGVLVVFYQIIKLPQKPLLLPYMHGFQIALSSISQDTSRMIQSFLFGSGYGTFLTDFTRFRTALFNSDTTLWNVSFSYSSSYILELVATTGIAGLLTFLFLIVKVVRSRVKALNPLFIAVVTTLGFALVLPLSFTLVFLLFVLLAFYAAFLNLENDKNVAEVSLSLVTLKNGLFSFHETEVTSRKKSESPLLPIILLVVILLASGFVGFWTVKYIMSDTKFAQSLSRESLNAGQKAYDLENSAIADYPYRSDYYRIFSQINFALATSLLNNIPANSSPSAQTQQSVLALLQQSINSGRGAVTMAPIVAVNWENLSQVYRNLIGVGQNAEQFAVASMNQAIQLDPTNPAYYVELGGVYYQLQRYDLAENAFRQAVSLKQDYSNAYYNLGHTLEQKGDLAGALQAYQVVGELVKANPDNYKKMQQEIAAVTEKIGKSQQQVAGAQTQAPEATAESANQQLQVPKHQGALPPTDKQVKLPPPPPTTPTPTKKAGTPTPTVNAEVTPTPAQ